MSNLSELLPAGGGGKNVNFVASGTLGNGKTVILNSNGTVTVVGVSTGSESLGSPHDIAGSTSIGYGLSVTYNVTEDKLVAVYFKSGDSDAYAVVGTVSGTTISWGTPVNASGAITGDNRPRVESIPNTSKVLFCFTTSAGGSAAVGTISGTSITFGTVTNYVSTGALPKGLSMAWDSGNSQMMITYFTAYDNDVFAMAATITGTTVSFTTQGSARVLSSGGNCINTDLAYDTNAAAFVASYRNGSNLGYCIVFTSDGTNITKGTQTQLPVYSNTNGVGSVSYDSTAQKVVFSMKDDSAAGYGIVGTVSGTSITFGTPTVFYTGALNTSGTGMGGVYAGSEAGTTTIVYTPTSDNYTYYVNGTVSGTGITFNTPVRAYSDNATVTRTGICPVKDGKVCILLHPSNTVGSMVDGYGYGAILQNVATLTNLTSTNLIGITSEATSSGGTAKINTWGGINEAQTSLTIASDYYAQTDGTITTATAGQKLGTAISTTTINMKDLT